MLGFNTNFMSLMTRRQLDNTTNILNLAVERMTTGFKVNHASDNAANYSIIQQMDTQISALDVAEDNASVGLDLLTTANDTLDLINERFIRLRNLAVQAENGTYGKSSLDSINIECKALVEEIKRIYKEAEFNGLRIYGSEFFETIPTDGTQPIATLGVDDEPEPVLNMSTTFATEATTLQELGIDYSSFEIYNSTGSLIESYEVEKTDTLGDIFNVLNTYGIAATMTDGVISLSSTNGRYVYGELIESFGITLDSDDFIAESSQTSEKMYCVVNENANEASTLAQLGALASGTDIITVKDKFGDKVADISVDSNTTLGGLFNKLGNYDIQGTVDDGVITFSSSEGNYLLSQGVIANLGIGVVEGSSVVTTGTGQTSADIVTYETITSTGGTVTTTQEEHTVTIWTTTTTSQTVTETVWTTTTTSTTQTQTITTTQTMTVTEATTFSQMGLTATSKCYIKNEYGNDVSTITVTKSTTMGSFISALESKTIAVTLTNGKLYFHSTKNAYISGDIATFLGVGTQKAGEELYQIKYNYKSEALTISNNSTVIGTSTVTAGEFKGTVSKVSSDGAVAISSLSSGASLIAGTTYTASSTDDLIKLVSLKIPTATNKPSVHIILTSDIDMSGITWNTGIKAYNIVLHGNGYKIKNLTGSSGLFSTLAYSATVENLGLVDVNISAASTSYGVGGLANQTSGNNTYGSVCIRNTFVTGTIVSSDTTYSTNAGVGGFVGSATADLIMDNVYASVNITASDSNAGGLIGIISTYSNDGDLIITNSYAEGSITAKYYAGGLVGNTSSGGGRTGNDIEGKITIEDSLSLASISSTGRINNSRYYGSGGFVGLGGRDNVVMNNICFSGNISNSYAGAPAGAIFGRTELDAMDTLQITNFNNTTAISNDCNIVRYMDGSFTLADRGITSGNLGIKLADGYTMTIYIDATKTVDQANNELAEYGVFFDVDGDLLQAVLTRPDATFVAISGGTNLIDLATSRIEDAVSYTVNTPVSMDNFKKKTSTKTVQTIYTTTSTSTTQTNTIYETTTTSTTQTNTIYETTTTETTDTETVWTTTTTSTTNTETTWTTTTSSTTETQTVDVVKTIGGSTTTTNVSMTADTSFALLELDSRGYVTVMNGSTRTIITVKTGDTVSDLISKLDKSGITATLNNGRLTLTPDAKSIYISGMSTNLIDALNLESDFYTSSLGVEMTDSNFINYDANTTIKANTSLSEIGVTSGELLVQKDGANYATIAVSDSQTVGSFTQQLADVGFDVKLANGAILISSEGDMLLTNAASDSSNAISVFSLGSVSQRIETTYANTDSSEIYKLAQIVNSYWKSTSAICLQVGTTGDESSRIEICTGFDIHDLDRFASIGKKTVNNIDYIKELDNIINTISAKQTEIGAYENRLESALEEISIRYENMVSSRSTLRDADLSEITSIYIQQQILQQASATLLSVANQSPQLALQLL